MRRAFDINQALSQIARSAQPLSFIDSAEYDPLLAAIGNTRLVLIGEALETRAQQKWAAQAK